jgi:uridine kinase
MKTNGIKVTLDHGIEKEVQEGTTLEEISKEVQQYHKGVILAGNIDNQIKELTFKLETDCHINFIDLGDYDGYRIYIRSLSFVLLKAVKELYKERRVVVSNSISKGIYFEIHGEADLTEEEVSKIEERMKELVKKDLPIEKKVISLDEARTVYEETGRLDRHDVLEFRTKSYVSMYSLDGLEDYFYGYMAPRTGWLQNFELKFYHKGIILRFPSRENPDSLAPFEEQKKLFNVFLEQKKWLKILGVSNVGDLNRIVKSGNINDFIRVAEALHEKKIAAIADMIAFHEDKKRVVLISGPSSSGKTTFAHRLAIQLRVNGLRPVTLSLDDYFLNREDTPRDEYGKYDFESLDAIDVPYFNKQLSGLIRGEEVLVPVFDFTTGTRLKEGRPLRIDDDQVMIIEGIHGLNEKLTSSIPREKKFKIYISALTALNIDNHNRISTTDTRLIRRMVRDYQFRGSSALNTIQIWPSVRRGEEKNIFPFQEQADVIFNSALNYELGALRGYAEKLLSDVEGDIPESLEVKRLLEFIRIFPNIDSNEIPVNSIAKEFLGGSCFM